MRELTVLIGVLCLSFASAIHESFNFVLPAAQRRCFFETLSRDSPAHKVEAFVLSGGNLDVLLTFHGPLIESDILKDFFEEPIFHETIDAHKEIDSDTLTYTTDFKPEKAGTYAICLDNRSSRFMSKVVQLDVRPISTPEAITLKVGAADEKKGDESDSARLEESLNALSQLHKGITKIQLQQRRDRHRLDLHSETNNSNYNSVFTGSIFETFIFIAVAIFQVSLLLLLLLPHKNVILTHCLHHQIFFVRRWFAAKTNPVKTKEAKAWA